MRQVNEVIASSTASCLPASARCCTPPGLRLLATKGPGESIGLPCLSRRSAPDGAAAGGAAPSALAGSAMSADACAQLAALRWACYARARGEVTVFTARAADLLRLVDSYPEMEPAVQQIVTQQETDLMVAEAMRQLRLLDEAPLPPAAALPQAAAVVANT
jgi:hypothetical protein